MGSWEVVCIVNITDTVPVHKSVMGFPLGPADLARADLPVVNPGLFLFPTLLDFSDTLYSALCFPNASLELLCHIWFVANRHILPVLQDVVL